MNADEAAAAMFMGLCHDCRRRNDNTDPLHGRRAARWLLCHPHILRGTAARFAQEIRYAIEVHNDRYDFFDKEHRYFRYGKWVDILKTADALDRYRFPREEWWLSDNFLRCIPSITEKAFAFDFCQESERRYVAGGSAGDIIKDTFLK